MIATARIKRFSCSMIFQTVESLRLSNPVPGVIQYYYRYYHTLDMFRSVHKLRQWMRHTKNIVCISRILHVEGIGPLNHSSASFFSCYQSENKQVETIIE
jgi:hypothetical protein